MPGHAEPCQHKGSQFCLAVFVQAPAKDSKQLFLQYAEPEDAYGLARSDMEVYDRAVRSVEDKDRFEVYNLYLARATQFFGVGKVRIVPTYSSVI